MRLLSASERRSQASLSCRSQVAQSKFGGKFGELEARPSGPARRRASEAKRPACHRSLGETRRARGKTLGAQRLLPWMNLRLRRIRSDERNRRARRGHMQWQDEVRSSLQAVGP